MVDITESNISVRSGSLNVTLSGFDGSSTSCLVLDIGTLDYEFDITEEESAKDSISQIMGNIDITIADNLGDGTSLINRFYDASSDITAKIVHTDNSSTINTYNFIIGDEDVKRGQEDRKVTFRLQVDPDISFTVSDFFSGSMDWGTPSTKPYEDVVAGNTVTCSALGEFIQAAIRELNTDNTEVFNSDDFTDTLPDSAGEDGDEVYVMVSGSCADNSQLVIDELMRVAISEGALFGSGLGKNFWCYRLFTGDSVTLSDDDVEEFDSIVGFNEYKEITTSFTGSACFSFQTADTENTIEYSPQKPSTFNITTDLKAASLGAYDHSNSKLTTNVVTKDGTALANGQASAYRTALTTTRGADKGFRVSLTVLGMKTVKPWETIIFNTDFESVYQGGEYRISNGRYDFKTDKSTLEVYRIS